MVRSAATFLDPTTASTQLLRQPRKSCTRELAGRLSTHSAGRRSLKPDIGAQRAAGEPAFTLDATDLGALLALIHATEPEDAQRCASHLRALLGSERSQLEPHIATLLTRTDELQRMKRLATTDSLTGVANRRAFGEALRRELSRSQRSGKPLAVLMLDIDDFKAINDTLSHAAGDQALRLVARAAREITREVDLVARIGGDEFALMLPETGAEEARAIGDRIRARLARVPGRGLSLGVSVGVAVTRRPCMSGPALLAAADDELYRDKATRKLALPSLFPRARRPVAS